MDFFQAIIFACIEGVCEYKIVSEPLPFSLCSEVAQIELVKYKKLDPNAMVNCLPQEIDK